MSLSWIGPARYRFIPLVVEETPGYLPPPPDYREFVRHRVLFDPDPASGDDLSLSAYVNAISSGRAWLDATVAAPVILRDLDDDDNATLLAIESDPMAHLFEYLAVVYPPNGRNAGSGMAQPGQIDFHPSRSPNRTRARCRFRHDAHIGTWAMEVLHNVTEIGDYYNGLRHPGRFDEMADATATHPSAYTKGEAGWLAPTAIKRHAGDATYVLHAVGLPGPPPAGRVTAVRVDALGSPRYLLIEARLTNDHWERGVAGAKGLPTQGVVIYEFAPESSPWPRADPNGPWPPLELRTPEALRVGERFDHTDGVTSVMVRSATAGGFVVEVQTRDVAVPFVQELSETVAVARITGAGLKASPSGSGGSGSWVWRQSPQAGTRVNVGSTVVLQLRTGPRP